MRVIFLDDKAGKWTSLDGINPSSWITRYTNYSFKSYGDMLFAIQTLFLFIFLFILLTLFLKANHSFGKCYEKNKQILNQKYKWHNF